MRRHFSIETGLSNFRSVSRIASLLLLCFCFAALFAADARAAGTGILKGKVFDYQTGKPVPDALVAIQGTAKSVLADKSGVFQIELPAGKYGISILKDEYYNTCYQDIEIESGKITTYKCELVTGDPRQQFFFQIGGITVLDKRDLLPEKTETTHNISSAEIEHYLSTNLGDVMDLVPGIERTKNPGLSQMNQLDLRGTAQLDTEDKSAARFGTKIIIDDIAISNNANMQTGKGTTYGSSVQAYAGTGLDLRSIPADNVQGVEVITGVPSVEYGDLTTGLVKVKTKIGAQPVRLKLKTNPDTKEANLSGGLNRFDTGVSYNLNYAWSERDIRLEGDEYARYNAQLNFKNNLAGEKLSILNKFYYTGVDDTYDLTGIDPRGRIQENKDKTLIYGQALEYKLAKDMKLEWSANVNYTKRDAYSQSLVGSDVRVMTDATEPGTYEGVFDAGAYTSQIWTRGEEWNVGAKLNLRADFHALRLNHALLMGGEYSFDDNVGEGKIFDPFHPPGGALGQRPLSFDDVPGMQSASFYLEDNLNGFLFMRPYNVNLGFRYEMYTPEELNLGGFFTDEGVVRSRNGTFLNPRIRLKYEPRDGTQLRFSWGRSSKMPPIVDLYQGPQYIDVVERNVSPPDSVPLVSTYVWNFDTEGLYGTQEDKGEISFDQKFGSLGIILTGWMVKADGMPRSEELPAVIQRYEWTDWPNAGGSHPIDTIYSETPGTAFYYNAGKYTRYGVEFTGVTKRIERISTAFRVTGAYTRSYSGAEGLYMSTPKQIQPDPANPASKQYIYPFYYYTEGWEQKLILDYNADWLIKRLGIWVTFFVQQTLFDWDKQYEDPIRDVPMYWDPLTGNVVNITPEQSQAYGLSRQLDECDLSINKAPNDRVLFNVNVSKSIGRGAEISFFVHNVFDDPAGYENCYGTYSTRNPGIFYGVEFSMILDELWKRAPSATEEK
jgi:outer membrane receptor protein involved in Fe transport